MGTVRDSNPHGPIDPERLASFEGQLGIRLPADYREFLVAHNRGSLVPEEIVFPDLTEPFTVLANPTFGLHDGPGSLEAAYGNCQDVVPAGVIGFAEDPGGNLFCLGVRGKHFGRVFFWDHERSRPGEEVPGFAGMTLLAGSFTDFVAHLGKPQPRS